VGFVIMRMETPSIQFMAARKIAGLVSIIAVITSIALIAMNGLSFGLDFTGGSLVELEFAKEPALETVREILVGAGFPDAVVQAFGAPTDVIVRLAQDNAPKAGDDVFAALQAASFKVELLRSEFVGSAVGEELREQGGLGLLLALGIVMLYVAFRFQFKFSVAAVVALIHDVLVVLGVFALFGLDFDLTVLAAVLAVIGYSLNDSIVVSDRIRENFRIMRTDDPLKAMDDSINQTLSRTLATSVTTLLVLLALLFLGGELIHNFALALTIGVAVGTYSSIYVVTLVLLMMGLSREDLLVSEKDQEVDDRP
jgi:preprotein translocase subunit SecF